MAPRDTSTAVLIRVDKSGHGDHTKIQDAINSVPVNNSQFVFIWVKPGVYREQVVVPSNKPYITLSGTNAETTMISWDESGEIHDTAALSVHASDFVGRFLTIKNTHGSGGKAVALRVTGDRAAFYACRILSYQDTLLDASGHHYFSNCYIEGAIDFIFGNATSLYEKCHLRYVSRDSGGAITAQKRNSVSDKGVFVFLGGKITAVGPGKLYLGRPWGTHARVVFARTIMANVVLPQGWNDWNKPKTHSTVFYGEYQCSGPGANRSRRVPWSRELSAKDAAAFLSKGFIGGEGWLRPSPTKFKRGFGHSKM